MSKRQVPSYRNNSCKFNLVKSRLQKCLEDGLSSRECAADLRISIATVNRYKCCLSAELNRVFSVPGEKQFVERQKTKAAYYKNAAEARAVEQKKQDTPPSVESAPKKVAKNEEKAK
jgi:hypothetical protein